MYALKDENDAYYINDLLINPAVIVLRIQIGELGEPESGPSETEIGAYSDLLDNKIIDSLRLQSICDCLCHQYRKHDRNRISQRIGELEHDDGE